MRIAAPGIFALLAFASSVPTAAAESTATVRYPYEQVWPAAIRFLRIDEGVKIVEKDSEAGYILFELNDDGASFRGSLEVAAITDSQGRQVSRLILIINERPTYMEQGMLDRFRTKLHRQLGPPGRGPKKPAPKPDKEPAPKPDKPPGTKIPGQPGAARSATHRAPPMPALRRARGTFPVWFDSSPPLRLAS